MRTLAGGGPVALLWEPKDCWVGVYWSDDLRHRPWPDQRRSDVIRSFYVCLLPMLPIRIEWRMRSR